MSQDTSFASTAASPPGSGRGARIAAASAALAVALFTFAYRYLCFERFPNDHFVHLSRAQQVVMGAVPLKDYSEYQAPLTVMFSAWMQMIFGPGLRSELWLVCGAFALAAAAICLITAALSGSVPVGLASALIVTAATPVSYSYPKVLPYALAFGAAWLYAQRPDSPRLWLLAVSVVFAGLMRHDHAIVLGAGAAVAVLARSGMNRHGAMATLHLLLAGLALTSPYLVWVQYYEGVGTYIATDLSLARVEVGKAGDATWSPARFEIDRSRPQWVRLADPQEPIVYVRWQPNMSDEARRRSEAEHELRLMGEIEKDAGQYEVVDASTDSLTRLIRDPAVKETAGINRETFRLDDRRPASAHLLQYLVLPGEGLRPAFVALLYYLAWALLLVVALLLAWRWKGLSHALRSVAAMAVIVQLIVCRWLLRDPLATRVRDVIVPLVLVLAFLPVMVHLRGLDTAARRWGRRIVLTTVFVVVGAAAAGAGSFGLNLRETGISHGWTGVVARTFEIRERYAPPYERVGFKPNGMISYVLECTQPSSRIFAMTFVPQLFFYTHREFAGGYDVLWPHLYVSDRQTTLVLQRLSHEDVPLVITANEDEAEMFETYPRIAMYVRQRYHEIGRFDAGQGKVYIVLGENDRKPVGVFEPGDLPCFVPRERTQLPLRDGGLTAWYRLAPRRVRRKQADGPSLPRRDAPDALR